MRNAETLPDRPALIDVLASGDARLAIYGSVLVAAIAWGAVSYALDTPRWLDPIVMLGAILAAAFIKQRRFLSHATGGKKPPFAAEIISSSDVEAWALDKWFLCKALVAILALGMLWFLTTGPTLQSEPQNATGTQDTKQAIDELQRQIDLLNEQARLLHRTLASGTPEVQEAAGAINRVAAQVVEEVSPKHAVNIKKVSEHLNTIDSRVVQLRAASGDAVTPEQVKQFDAISHTVRDARHIVQALNR